MYIAEKEIGGAVYGVRAFPADAGLRLGVKVGKIFAPFVGSLAAASKADVSSPVMAEALDGLFERLDKADVVALADQLLAVVERSGVPIGKTWRVEYAGKLGELREILQFVIAESFGGFLSMK